jgi:hypothetical protein
MTRVTILSWIEAKAVDKDSETRNSRSFRHGSVGIWLRGQDLNL